jgi:anti-sigma factor RsiW
MRYRESHVSDQDLALFADGEIDPGRAPEVEAHLAECWFCRARKQDVENAMMDFVRLHRQALDNRLPPRAPIRAMLKARLAQTAEARRASPAAASSMGLRRRCCAGDHPCRGVLEPLA